MDSRDEGCIEEKEGCPDPKTEEEVILERQQRLRSTQMPVLFSEPKRSLKRTKNFQHTDEAIIEKSLKKDIKNPYSLKSREDLEILLKSNTEALDGLKKQKDFVINLYDRKKKLKPLSEEDIKYVDKIVEHYNNKLKIIDNIKAELARRDI